MFRELRSHLCCFVSSGGVLIPCSYRRGGRVWCVGNGGGEGRREKAKGEIRCGISAHPIAECRWAIAKAPGHPYLYRHAMLPPVTPSCYEPHSTTLHASLPVSPAGLRRRPCSYSLAISPPRPTTNRLSRQDASSMINCRRTGDAQLSPTSSSSREHSVQVTYGLTLCVVCSVWTSSPPGCLPH